MLSLDLSPALLSLAARSKTKLFPLRPPAVKAEPSPESFPEFLLEENTHVADRYLRTSPEGPARPGDRSQFRHWRRHRQGPGGGRRESRRQLRRRRGPGARRGERHSGGRRRGDGDSRRRQPGRRGRGDVRPDDRDLGQHRYSGQQRRLAKRRPWSR